VDSIHRNTNCQCSVNRCGFRNSRGQKSDQEKMRQWLWRFHGSSRPLLIKNRGIGICSGAAIPMLSNPLCPVQVWQYRMYGRDGTDSGEKPDTKWDGTPTLRLLIPNGGDLIELRGIDGK